LSCAAAHCRGGYYFCLDTKGSKKSRQQGCFPAPCRFFTLFSLFVTFVPHITQKAKPAFPPLRWPALVVKACAFDYGDGCHAEHDSLHFLFSVSREDSGENGQNDGGLVRNGRA